ncbi:MAG: dienelactone hydrolase family protein [Saccharospirillaceae bacterium]|nr:alpha/beta hydrolase [Pseudomonadales bacterium]NRB79552.1 dienelactone hydrolase family protein [Saccharospirillaceae bacterium]
MSDLQYVQIKPQNPKYAIIWLHGLGDSGNGWLPIAKELQLDIFDDIHFIFPHAPQIPVTVNGGLVMPAWYDIYEMSLERKIDHDQIQQSSKGIKQIINQLITDGIASDKILLIGFSQGGAVAYESALSFDKPLAGLMALSTYFATEQKIILNDANKDIPIIIQHGTIDPVVPFVLGEHAKQKLTALNYNVNLQSYVMEHTVCPQQQVDLKNHIQTLLSDK